MTNKVIATVKIRDRRDMGRTEEEVKQAFGLGIPTHIHLYFTDALIEKMKKIQSLIRENNLTTIKTLSSYRKSPDSSYAIFYRNDEEMHIPKYVDGGRKYDIVELNNFSLTCDSFYGVKFSASFLYTSPSCDEFVVNTEYFDLS